MSNAVDVWYKSDDGLNLYARDYPSKNTDRTLLCMPGLTRNSDDFLGFCDLIKGDYRVVTVDQRG